MAVSAIKRNIEEAEDDEKCDFVCMFHLTGSFIIITSSANYHAYLFMYEYIFYVMGEEMR